MTQPQLINLGTAPNSGDGDSLRTAFTKINYNTATLYNAAIPTGPAGSIQYVESSDLIDVATDGSVTVAVGSDGTVRSTVDGRTWTMLSLPAGVTVTKSVIYTVDYGWFITSSSGTLLQAWDAAGWNVIATAATDTLNSIATDGTTLVAVGDNGATLRSTDGATWAVTPAVTASNLHSVTWSAALVSWLAVGATGTAILSADAVNWTVIPMSTVNALRSVSATSTGAITVGDSGTLLTTTDGINWNTRTLPVTVDMYSVTVASTLAWAVGADGTTLTAGTDLSSWSYAASQPVVTTALRSIRWSSGKLWTVGNSGVAWSKTDVATEWSDASIPLTTTGSSALLFNETTGLLVEGDIRPGTNDVHSIGSDTERWQSLYLSNGIDINGTTIQANATAIALTALSGNPADLVVNDITAQSATLDTLTVNSFTATTFAVDDLVAGNIVTSSVVTDTINADEITATTFIGDGGNITGLAVQSIVAGANVFVSNVGGTWTISAVGGGGGNGTTLAHPPVNSVQLAAIDGSFTSSPDFLFDAANSRLAVTGFITANTFTGNVVATTITSQNAVITGNLEVGNVDFTGTVTINTTVAESANLGNIRISHSNIREIGDDDFTISADTANFVITGANTSLNTDAKFLKITGGDTLGTGRAGQVTVTGGSGTTGGIGGALNLLGGAGGATGGLGGNILIAAGNSGTGSSGGTITIRSGSSNADPFATRGSDIVIQTGNTVDENGGTLYLQGANTLGATYRGGNVRITAGTGVAANGNIFIGNIRWPHTQGVTNQVLVTDGVGAAYWSAINANIPASITVSNIINGTSNVAIVNASGNVTVGVNGVANVLTISETATVASTFKANTFTLGNSTQTACSTTWYKYQTSTAAANQVVVELPASAQISTDFKVITYDMTASTRQSSMITSVTYGSQTSYSEYARTVINTVIADFSVDQVGGKIRLLVTPRVAHNINYTIIVSTY